MNEDLISRSALLADIQTDVEDGGVSGMVAGALRRYVRRAPVVEAVIPVRCRDCKHGRKSDHAYAVDTAKPLCECNFMYGPHQWYEYCSWGERRADHDA